ncbi:MAG TPA: glycosyltransferase family 2 protein [bacterium]|nr:glycosyltransferase family 2 protein [bacterium]
MYKEQKISMVIPCHNEEEGVSQLIPLLNDVPIVDEIVIVDNNCTDRTAEIAADLGARVVRETIPGYGAAHRAGITAAAGDIIVTMDGDCTYPVESISRLVKTLIDGGFDFITCRRMPDRWRNFNGLLRLIGNVVLTATTKILFFRKIMDSQSGMWVFKKSVFSRIESISDGMGFSEEIKLRAFIRDDVKSLELPILYFDRVGMSALNLWHDGFTNWIFLFQLRFKGITRWERRHVVSKDA